MPITPYSTPIRTEYKPLGLEALAKPLSEIQNKYDLTNAAIQNEDFQLDALNLGSDPVRAKALQEEIKAAQEELVADLNKSKNYKESANKLMNLRKMWKNNEELQALEGNKQSWLALDKEEREKVKTGYLTQEDYDLWKQRSLEDFEGKGGTSYKDGQYNTVGMPIRQKNLNDEFYKEQREIMALIPETVDEYFSRNKSGLTPWQIENLTTTVKSRDAGKLASETEQYLRTKDKYKNFFNEEADYSYWRISKSPEQKERVAQTMLDDKISQFTERELGFKNALESKNKNYQEQAKKYFASDEYKEEQEEKEKLIKQRESGNYDDKLVKNLYSQRYINEKFNSSALANVLDYKNTTRSRSFSTIPGLDKNGNEEGSLNGSDVSVDPNMDKLFTLDGFNKKLYDNRLNLRTSLSENIYKLADGTIGKILERGQGVKPDAQNLYKRSLSLLQAFTESGSDWQSFRKTANRKGNVWMNDDEAQKIFKSFKDPNTIQYYNQNLENARNYNVQADIAKENIKTISNNVSKGDLFKGEVSRLENQFIISEDPEQYDMYEGQKEEREKIEFKKTKQLNPKFVSTSYSKEKLEKLGITKERVLTYGEVAKLNGYRSFQEATQKEFNYGKTPKTDNIIKAIIQSEGVNTQEMSFNVNGAKSIELQNKQKFRDLGDLSTFVPMYEKGWQNVPGFDDKGNPKPGTKITTDENRRPRLHIFGNQIGYSVSYTDDQGIARHIEVLPKIGMEYQVADDIRSIRNSFNVSKPDEERSYQTTNVVLYNSVTNSNLSQSLFDKSAAGIKISEEYIPGVPYPVGIYKEKDKSTGKESLIVKEILPDGSTQKTNLPNFSTVADFKATIGASL